MPASRMISFAGVGQEDRACRSPWRRRSRPRRRRRSRRCGAPARCGRDRAPSSPQDRGRRGAGAGAISMRPSTLPTRADAREPGVAGEIIAARQAGVRRRQQSRLEPDVGSRLERRRAARRQAHAVRRLLGRKAFDRMNPQDEARAGAAEIHLLDEAFDDADRRPVDDRRGDARRAPAADSSPAKKAQSPQSSRKPMRRRAPERRGRASAAVSGASSHKDGSRSAQR